MYDLHGTELNFVHKRIIGGLTGGVKSLLTGGNPLAGGLGGFLAGGGGGGGGGRRRSQAELAGIREHVRHGHTIADDPFLTPSALAAAGVPSGTTTLQRRCTWPKKRQPDGSCRFDLDPGEGTGFPGDPLPGTRPFLAGPQGEAVMGRYGAGMVPIELQRRHADCTAGGQIRGMVLGNDGICYNKRDIRNSERMWPRGRQPLLTGGEQRAISIASTAAGKLMRSRKRLKKVASTFAKAC